MGVAEDEAGDSLGSSVRSLLNLRGSHRATFANFDQMTTQWARRRRKAVREGERTPLPPVIGLLMIFSMAAERMGARDPGTVKTEAGYYAQLERLLRIPVPDSTRIRASFRATSETYWEALSLWLEDLDGAYGLPSAHALTHRYVGLPISQALIRDTERRHMHSMFVDQGFVVGVPVSHEEMRDAIENWIHSPSAAPNAAFRKMWASEETRPKIADAAIAELLAWDGGGIIAGRGPDAKTGAAQGRCFLTVRERRKALKRSYALGLAVKQVRGVAGDARIKLAGNETATVDVSPFSSGLADLRTPAEIAPDSLLEGEVIIEWADGSRAQRSPKRVVVFGQDAATGSYIEIDRIVPSLGSRLLVKDEGDLVAAAEAILKDAAAPGFKRIDGPGYDLPVGWALFSDVQLLRAPRSDEIQRHRDLSCLEPRMSTQLAIQGGLRLPGRIPKWVAGRGMHVVVTAEGETPVDLVASLRILRRFRPRSAGWRVKLFPLRPCLYL
ncbi:hypothetical protein LK10_17940 [Sinomonas humi]|uniref:Uncharacterized protein n=1 Tax=Sinomonas humi TaxID=1338436 RepID=A0A0B2AH18_9MICC|nr:hypothetical protein LK10_17940 [Sinomonas humi]